MTEPSKQRGRTGRAMLRRRSPDGPRAEPRVRLWAAVSLAVSGLLGLWLLRNQLAGASRTVTLAKNTVDGTTAGWVLSALLWVTLGAALVLSILVARSRMDTAGPASQPERDFRLSESATSVNVGLPRKARPHRRRWRGICFAGLGAIFVVAVYHGLLRPGVITWGDWGYFINAGAVKNYFPVPSLWSFANLGIPNILGGALDPIESMMGAMARVGIPYSVLERLWFYVPAVVLSYLGAAMLARQLNASASALTWSAVFYSVNPYALALISGGQLTVGVGYALFPWVALAAVRMWSKGTIGAGAALGMAVGIQAWFDPRTAGLSVAGLLLSVVVLTAGSGVRTVTQAPKAAILLSGLLFILLQGPWLVPAVMAVPAHLPAGYTTAGALSTFSLITLADGLTVFHPFWPEMQFIALHSLPILWLVVPVAMGLALFRAPGDTGVQVGGALFLVSAALVSGANDPFGPLNSWLFTHIPGMDLFRDPSPYLGLAAIGVVVAVSAASGAEPARHSAAPGAAGADEHPKPGSLQIPKVARALVGVWAAALVVVSAWPALSGALGHNLAPRAVPARYVELAREILRGPPGPVLWIPSTSRFAPVSSEHPSESAFSLEQMTAESFPNSASAFSWLGVPSAVETLIQQYDVRTVVVRDSAASYRNISIDPTATRRAALTVLSSLTGTRMTRLPGLTLFQLSAPPYPLGLYQAVLGAGGPRLESDASASPLSSGGAFSVTFGHKLQGWGPVGDGNDYLHQSLAQAGISAAVLGRGRNRFLRLAVRYGAASISRQLPTCPTSGIQQVLVRYRTTGTASLSVLVFTAAQAGPVANVSLARTGGRWETASTRVILAPTLQTWQKQAKLSGCALILSAEPSAPGTLSSADVSSVSLSAPTPTPAACVAFASSTDRGAGCQLTAPAGTQMEAGGDRITAAVRRSSKPQLVTFWQLYNSGWVARGSGGDVLRHVRVDGWANGFLLPPSVRPTSLEIVYQPQLLVGYGYLGLFGAAAVVVLIGSASLRTRRARLRHR